MNLRDKWDNLAPRTKQIVVLAAVLGALSILITVVSPDPKSRDYNQEEPVVENVLTDRSTRELGIDAISARLRKLEDQNQEKEQKIQRLSGELERVRTDSSSSTEISRRIAQLQAELEDVKEDKQEQQKVIEKLQEEGVTQSVSPTGGDDQEQGRQKNGSGAVDPLSREGRGNTGYREQDSDDNESEGNLVTADDIFGDRSQKGNGGQRQQPQTQQDGAPIQESSSEGESQKPDDSFGLVDVGSDSGETSQGSSGSDGGDSGDSASGEESEDTGVYMPAGSLMTGVLMTGVDAPTGQGAREDPFPVVMRLKKDAILPNHYRADVKECFAILAGFGELASERVMFRTEGISCVRDDGRTVEAKIDGYATGEDGKAGVRGTLVTKQGQMLAKSMTAGFFEGLSGAFDVNPVPVLDTSGGNGSQQFTSSPIEDTGRSGLVSGAQNSLGRVADFYLDLADQMFPVLEVDAGRKVDIVLVRGAELKIKGEMQ